MSLISVDLPEPETPVTQVSKPDRQIERDVLQIVAVRLDDAQTPLVGRRALGPDSSMLRVPDRYWPVIEVRVVLHLLRRAFGDHHAAVHARARTHVDHVVGHADHVLVVLDDDHRIADDRADA